MKNHSHPTLQQAARLTFYGNLLLLSSVSLLLLSIYLAYVIPQQLSLQMQIACHITMLIFATGLKFGYVLRLSGQHRSKRFQQQQI